MEIHLLQDFMEQLHPVTIKSLTDNRAQSRAAAEKGQLETFANGEFSLMTLEHFNAGEIVC